MRRTKGKRIAPLFYGFNRMTGEIYVPETLDERRHCIRNFLSHLYWEFKIDPAILRGWKLFKTEADMENYVHNFCYGQ